MHWENAPLLIILILSVLGNNNSVSVAALLLLLIKLLGYDEWFPAIESHGISVGITVLTMAVLVPIASGRISAENMLAAFKDPLSITAVAVGIVVAILGSHGVPFMRDTPEAVTALVVGTIIGVCFFGGLPVGPLIAGGMVAMLTSLTSLFK